MKYFHGRLEEINGEREYSYDYLIKAKSLEEASQRLIAEASGFYGADGMPVSGTDDAFEFFNGEIFVRVDSIGQTTKAQFVKHMLQKCEI